MDNFLKIGHSYSIGDLISALPGFQKIYREFGTKVIVYQRLNFPNERRHVAKDRDGDSVCMDHAIFNLLRPLLIAQEYICDFIVWEGQPVDWNFDTVRDSVSIPIPNSDIHWWNMFIFPDLQCDLSIPWLKIEPSELSKGKIVINITNRYRNAYIDYYFLEKHVDRTIFVGTTDEYQEFKTRWGLNISYYQCDNFCDLASFIAGCDLFIGVQSACWHMAEAMGIKRILEVCAEFPNTIPKTNNGYAYLHQKTLEILFNKLIA